jgi:hypothetical protein
MPELEYPEGHPANRDVRGKNMVETHTGFEYDYKPDHPARGGQGQPVLFEQGGNIPVDGFKHLYGLPGATLADCEKEFEALAASEQEQRRKWNETGVPPEAIDKVAGHSTEGGTHATRS